MICAWFESLVVQMMSKVPLVNVSCEGYEEEGVWIRLGDALNQINF